MLAFPLKLFPRWSQKFHPGHSLSLCNRTCRTINPRIVRSSYLLPLPLIYNMPPSLTHRIPPDPPSDSILMREATPAQNNESRFDSIASNSDMIFGPLEFDEGQQFSPEFPWDSLEDLGSHGQSYLSESFDFNQSNALFGEGPYSGIHPADDNSFQFSQWLKEPECPPLDTSMSSPIPIRNTPSIPQTPPSFHPYVEHVTFPQNASFSPSDFAMLHPLPRSTSPAGFSENSKPFPARSDNVHDMSLQPPPAWASQLWDSPSRSDSRSPASPWPSAPHAPTSKTPYALKRQSLEARTRKSSLGQVFQSSSAPSPVHSRAPNSSRPYSRRAESVSVCDDRDATVRRKKRLTSPEESSSTERPADSCTFSRYLVLLNLLTFGICYLVPSKSLLQPPKLAPSAWQLYFTDWISRHQATNTRKLNVAQAAKEAGQEYALLNDSQKEVHATLSCLTSPLLLIFYL